VIHSTSAGVRSAEEGTVQGSAVQQKAQCGGTRRDRSRRCGGTVKVRGAIEAAGAEAK